MSNISRYLQPGENIDHTPAAAVYAGNILRVGSVPAFSSHDIAASVKGAVAVSGVLRAPFVGTGCVANRGDNVYWDANASPLNGHACSSGTIPNYCNHISFHVLLGSSHGRAQCGTD